jgi:nitronate monooxygenase
MTRLSRGEAAQGLLARLGMRHPLIQAPMAGVATPALAAAVSQAGALGTLGLGASDAAGARAMIGALRAATDRPFGVNVFVHATARPDEAREAAWLAALAPVFARFGAEPPAHLRTIYRSFADDPELQRTLIALAPRWSRSTSDCPPRRFWMPCAPPGACWALRPPIWPRPARSRPPGST